MNIGVSKKRLVFTGLLTAFCVILLAANLDLFVEKRQFSEQMLSLVALLLLGGCYVQSVQLTLPRWLNGLWMIGAFLMLPYLMVYIIEGLAGHDAAQLAPNIFWLNYFWCQMVYLLLFALTNHYQMSVVLGSVFCFVVGAVNYFVLLFRSSPFQLTDILSVGTAADVAGNYVIAINYDLLLQGSTIFFAVCVACVARFHHKRRQWYSVAGSLVLLAFVSFSVNQFYSADTWRQHNLTINFWNPLQTYEECGTTLALAMEGKYLRPEKPAHYSAKMAETIVLSGAAAVADGAALPVVSVAPELSAEPIEPQPAQPAGKITTGSALQQQQAEAKQQEQERQREQLAQQQRNLQKANGEKPNIIAIMNESYADLSVLGEFETSVPYMRFYQSLKENTIRGNLSVSVLGGGTCNSEFEFLTGMTTAFLPTGVMAYQQYINSDLDSLATILQAQGYKAMAFHPGKPDSWKRDVVYPRFGFEAFLTETDMENPTYMREAYVTDSSDYQEVIKLFEEKGDDKLFLFNVTIQNHGGYQLNTVDIPKWVSLKGGQRYPETEQYLSIMHASDVALQELITYFKQVKEPTVIVFFGDHQPSVESQFVESLLGKPLSALNMEEVQKRYKVPFFIWANYDIEEQYYESISANYLAMLTLKTAGVELPLYYQYLDGLQQQVPMINSLGYADNSGQYHSFGDDTAERELIEEYKIVQYNYLFGGHGRVEELYTVQPGNE